MKALEAANLRKTYHQRGRPVEAVRSVSLSLTPGEVLAFLGPNGAGKTTSIKMIAGLIRQFSGSTYQIELKAPLDRERIGKITKLGAEIQREKIIRTAALETLYQVLEALKPLPLVGVQQDQANLTDIFLKLVWGNHG